MRWWQADASVAAERRFVGAGRAGNMPAKSVPRVVSGDTTMGRLTYHRGEPILEFQCFVVPVSLVITRIMRTNPVRESSQTRYLRFGGCR